MKLLRTALRVRLHRIHLFLPAVLQQSVATGLVVGSVSVGYSFYYCQRRGERYREIFQDHDADSVHYYIDTCNLFGYPAGSWCGYRVSAETGFQQGEQEMYF